MTIAVSFTNSVQKKNGDQTLNLTGASASTNYVLEVTGSTVAWKKQTTVKTDGSGAASWTFSVQDHLPNETFTGSVRPLTEYSGTTTAAATATFTTKPA